MQRVGVWMSSADLRAGEAALLLGPDDSGTLDPSGEPAGYIRPVDLPAGQGHVRGRYSGPAHLGVRGAEPRATLVRSRPLASGLHEFAVLAYDAQTGAPAGASSATISVYVNTWPRPPRQMRPQEALVDGRLRFDFGKDVGT